jgi:protein-disulfide isomerase
MESPESMALIRQMAEEGKNSKIEGTPTIFVNNRKLDRGQILPVLQAVYEQIKNN